MDWFIFVIVGTMLLGLIYYTQEHGKSKHN